MSVVKYDLGHPDIVQPYFASLELNNVAFRRDGRIEAQCALDPASFGKNLPAENGMILQVDKAAGLVKLPVTTAKLPYALHYSTEHMYDERKVGLNEFYLLPGRNFPYPRMGYLAVGDLFTTDCISFNDTEFDDADDLEETITTGFAAGTAYYGGVDATTGRILVSATAPTAGPVLKVVRVYTVPNGGFGLKFQVLSC